MAASRLGSPGPTGSGSSRDVSTDPAGDRRNCGRVDMSCVQKAIALIPNGSPHPSRVGTHMWPHPHNRLASRQRLGIGRKVDVLVQTARAACHPMHSAILPDVTVAVQVTIARRCGRAVMTAIMLC